MTEWDGMEELGWLAYGTLEFFCLAFFFFPPTLLFFPFYIGLVGGFGCTVQYIGGGIFIYIYPFRSGNWGSKAGEIQDIQDISLCLRV